MEQIDWVARYKQRASFCDEMAAIAEVTWLYNDCKRRALRNRINVLLVRLGVPGHWLDVRFKRRITGYEAQIERLTPILLAYTSGDKTMEETKDALMAFFDMPMPPRDAYHLNQYLEGELKDLTGAPDDIWRAANGLSGMIETEQHDYAYRVAYGWPERPCPWGGDDWHPGPKERSVSFE